jgi:hypothetical protein
MGRQSRRPCDRRRFDYSKAFDLTLPVLQQLQGAVAGCAWIHAGTPTFPRNGGSLRMVMFIGHPIERRKLRTQPELYGDCGRQKLGGQPVKPDGPIPRSPRQIGRGPTVA